MIKSIVIHDVVVDHSNFANGKSATSLTDTGEGLLLRFHIALEQRTSISIVIHTAAHKAIPVEFSNDAIFGDRLTKVTVQKRRFRRSLHRTNVPIAGGQTSSTRSSSATVGFTI